jgi:hypothetical protein
MAKEKFDFIQPIKDIPKALKGFPKNLIHVWKDPVKNSAEVETRKKEIYPLLYLFAGFYLITVILAVIIPDAENVLMIFSILSGALVVACIFLLVLMKKANEKFADLECTNCKKRITYDENVEIKVIDKKFTVTKNDKTIEQDGVPYQSTITAKGKEKVVLEITCKCQDCGTKKTFTHEFVTVECEKSAVKVPYVTSGALLVQFEQDVRNEGAEGFENKKRGTSVNGVEIKYIKTPESLVKGYFGDTIQMR